MSSKINNFVETIKIVGTGAKNQEEAYMKVKKLCELNQNKPKDNSKLQMFLDWLAQPTSLGSTTEEEAKSDVMLINGYWRSIAARNKASTPDVHQHVHFHQHNGEQETKKEVSLINSDIDKMLEMSDEEYDKYLERSTE